MGRAADLEKKIKKWFLEHSDPPDGHYSIILTIHEV